MAGYLSLFFDDARQTLPQINLQESKQKIYSDYKKVFRKPNPLEIYDIQSITENTILTNISNQLQQGIVQGQSQNTNIPYWNVNMSTAYQYIKQASSETEKISQSLKYIEEVQKTLSIAIEKGQGIVSNDLIEQLKSNKQSLKALASSYGQKVADNGFQSAFWGSLKGCIVRAQGVVHEAAGAVGAYIAEQYVNEEFHKSNSNLRVIIEATGGKLIEDSQIAKKAEANNLNLGSSNNAKNDLTIMVFDKGQGKVIWTSGISLKSTASKNPSFVSIVETTLGTILNKIYSQQVYLNLAGALGQGDWVGTRQGIGKLAQKSGVKTSGATLAAQWRDVVYDAIYSQMLDFFGGSGHKGILNNAQYLLINAKPIPLYDLFALLEYYSSNKQQTDTAISGIRIGGAQKAINRSQYTQKNINAFVKLRRNISLNEARIQRSSNAWESINNILQSTKIRISLKWAELGLGATR